MSTTSGVSNRTVASFVSVTVTISATAHTRRKSASARPRAAPAAASTRSSSRPDWSATAAMLMRPRKKRNTFHWTATAASAVAGSIAPATSTAAAPRSATVLSRIPRGRVSTPMRVRARMESATAPVRLVGVLPGEGHVLDEAALGLERPGAVVRELTRRPRQAAQHDGGAARLVLSDPPDEVRPHPHQLAGAVLALELAVAAGQL